MSVFFGDEPFQLAVHGPQLGFFTSAELHGRLLLVLMASSQEPHVSHSPCQIFGALGTQAQLQLLFVHFFVLHKSLRDEVPGCRSRHDAFLLPPSTKLTTGGARRVYARSASLNYEGSEVEWSLRS